MSLKKKYNSLYDLLKENSQVKFTSEKQVSQEIDKPKDLNITTIEDIENISDNILPLNKFEGELSVGSVYLFPDNIYGIVEENGIRLLTDTIPEEYTLLADTECIYITSTDKNIPTNYVTVVNNCQKFTKQYSKKENYDSTLAKFKKDIDTTLLYGLYNGDSLTNGIMNQITKEFSVAMSGNAAVNMYKFAMKTKGDTVLLINSTNSSFIHEISYGSTENAYQFTDTIKCPNGNVHILVNDSLYPSECLLFNPKDITMYINEDITHRKGQLNCCVGLIVNNPENVYKVNLH